jgi:EAL domain-containing protein (putative c-di-GMP-specific phosphodiesterase class I)
MSLEYLVEEKDPSIDGTSAELAGWPKPLQRLREALEHDEFTLYCQPIIALKPQGQGAAALSFPMAEVLVRMREEERALLPPGEFLPVFEHYGMMPELDRWVVRHTIKHLARGSRIPCFMINVSTQTLKDAQFAAFVEAEMRAAKLPMEAVLLEIDESDALAQPKVAAGFAAAVRAYGGGVVIDGFCRRAVSFSPFKELRPRFVKVDGVVIRKLMSSEAAQTKLQAVVQVADLMEIGVIAECVEEKSLLAGLKDFGVGYAQGFGIFQPQPIESLATVKF